MSTSVEIPSPDQARDGLRVAPYAFGGWCEQWAREWRADNAGGAPANVGWPAFRQRSEAALRARLTPEGTFRDDPARSDADVGAAPAVAPWEGRALELPRDCLDSVLRHLDAASLRACRLVSREWSDAASHPLAWRGVSRASVTVETLTELAVAARCFPAEELKATITSAQDILESEAETVGPAAHCPSRIDVVFEDEEETAMIHTALERLAGLFPDARAVRAAVTMDADDGYSTLEEVAAAIAGMPRLEVLHLVGHAIGMVPWHNADDYDEEPREESAVVPALQEHPALVALRLEDGNISGTCLAGILASARRLRCFVMMNSCDFGEWGDELMAPVNQTRQEHAMGESLETFLISGSYQDDATGRSFNQVVGRDVCLAEDSDEPRHYID